MSRFLSLVTIALAASASLVSASPSRTTRDGPSFNPDISVVKAFPATVVGRNTNAARFAQGLPPLNPTPARRRKNTAARAVPSGTPDSKDAVIRATDATTGDFLGYLATSINSFGEYGAFTQTTDEALKFKYDTTGGPIDLVSYNSPDVSNPFIGAVSGYSNTDDNLGVGSYNYAYIVPTGQTPALSSAIAGTNTFTGLTSIPEDIESAIWTVAADTLALTAQWVNTDSSLPTTYIILIDDILTLVGDVDYFQATFVSPVTVVTLSLENL